MIVVDTNVLSELMKSDAAPAVTAWAQALPRRTLYTTVITLAEILYGLELMPVGARKAAGIQAAARMFDKEFADRVLLFDDRAARPYATILAGRRRAGRPIGPIDAQIAAIARANGMAVATRNMRDFVDCGVDLINPWEA